MTTLIHPKLPGREIYVPESGVAPRERAGWRRADRTPRPVQKAVEQPPVDQPQNDTQEGTES